MIYSYWIRQCKVRRIESLGPWLGGGSFAAGAGTKKAADKNSTTTVAGESTTSIILDVEMTLPNPTDKTRSVKGTEKESFQAKPYSAGQFTSKTISVIPPVTIKEHIPPPTLPVAEVANRIVPAVKVFYKSFPSTNLDPESAETSVPRLPQGGEAIAQTLSQIYLFPGFINKGVSQIPSAQKGINERPVKKSAVTTPTGEHASLKSLDNDFIEQGQAATSPAIKTADPSSHTPNKDQTERTQLRAIPQPLRRLEI